MLNGTITERARSLKSKTAATMVGGPKEFGGTKAFKPLVQRYVIVSFGPPKSIVLSLKFHVRQASWLYVYHCHETLNKALNDEEIVYFGTILMIKTCFGAKLVIKTWFTQFLSLVQFVEISALFGDQSGYNFGVGDQQSILRAGA